MTPAALPSPPIPRGCSEIHHDLTANNVVFFSIDLEHGGDWAGILQLSSVAFTLDGTELETFNEYVKPPTGAIIPDAQSEVNHLSQQSAAIQNAQPIAYVWPQFVEYVERQLCNGTKKGVMVAWSGKACDCEWVFRVTELKRWTHTPSGAAIPGMRMPRGLDYFIDPGNVIKEYPSCKLNNKWTELVGYGLAQTWCYVKQLELLEGEHDSLADAKAQKDVFLDARFKPFVDKKKTVVPITDVFKAKRTKGYQN